MSLLENMTVSELGDRILLGPGDIPDAHNVVVGVFLLVKVEHCSSLDVDQTCSLVVEQSLLFTVVHCFSYEVEHLFHTMLSIAAKTQSYIPAP